jgi:hypothetical protein
LDIDYDQTFYDDEYFPIHNSGKRKDRSERAMENGEIGWIPIEGGVLRRWI